MACFGEQEAALKSRWLPIDHEDATRMIHLLDRDRNGMVSYEEFRSFAYLLPESQVNSLSNVCQIFQTALRARFVTCVCKIGFFHSSST